MADSFKDAVCIDAGRVYDSCCDRDCLEDLRVCFCPADQEKVNNAIGVKARSCEILNVSVEVEPVTFNRGYYSVDMMFYFLVKLDLYYCGSPATTTVNGVATFNKKVILFGSDGNAKVFSSIYVPCDTDTQLPMTSNYPKASVQTVDPIVLNSTISPICGCDNECSCSLPSYVQNTIGGIAPAETAKNKINVTVGLFTVVQLIRNVQMLVPVYDFCVPEKECTSTTDNPCELFKRIKFPVDEFFPPQELCDDTPGCTACDDQTTT